MIQVINIGTQIQGRKCFCFYETDLDMFLKVRGQSTFDSLKDFEEATQAEKWTKRRFNIYYNILKKWNRES
jgi:hypothetical protein